MKPEEITKDCPFAHQKIDATFTTEQVKALNDYQKSGRFHPFTCGTDDCRCDLIAVEEGWVCPECDYTQDWAHDFMARTKLDDFVKMAQQNLETVKGIAGKTTTHEGMKTVVEFAQMGVDLFQEKKEVEEGGEDGGEKRECWDYNRLASGMSQYEDELGDDQDWLRIEKIVVPSEKDKQQLLLALEYLHNNFTIDTNFMAVNRLVHLYENPEIIEVSQNTKEEKK